MMSRHRQQGFVLVTTLVFIVISLLAVGYFAEKVDRARDLTAQARARSEAGLAMHSSLHAMLYRLAVVRPSLYGFGLPPNALRVDNHPYAHGNITLQLMDQQGLMSLRFVDRLRMERLLALFGVPLEQHPLLIDSLEDYIDADDLRRINGAEAPQYRARGLPAPANVPLRNTTELLNVMGWREQSGLWQDERFAQLLTTARVTGINPNAAPEEILATLPRVDREIAQSLIRFREQQPLDNTLIAQLTGMNAEQMQFTIFPFPSRHLQLTLSCACPHPAIQYNIHLTPMSELAPWSFEGVRLKAAGAPPPTTTPLPKLVETPPLSAGAFSP